jgi:hypothetical protein
MMLTCNNLWVDREAIIPLELHSHPPHLQEIPRVRFIRLLQNRQVTNTELNRNQ